jgi:hypothetical protein
MGGIWSHGAVHAVRPFDPPAGRRRQGGRQGFGRSGAPPCRIAWCNGMRRGCRNRRNSIRSHGAASSGSISRCCRRRRAAAYSSAADLDARQRSSPKLAARAKVFGLGGPFGGGLERCAGWGSRLFRTDSMAPATAGVSIRPQRIRVRLSRDWRRRVGPSRLVECVCNPQRTIDEKIKWHRMQSCM